MSKLVVSPYCGVVVDMDALPNGSVFRSIPVGKWCPITHKPLDSEAVAAFPLHHTDPDVLKALRQSYQDKVDGIQAVKAPAKG